MEFKRNLKIDYREHSLLFERAMKKFQIKKILYRNLFKGKGLEFEGYRFFDSEDDFDMIDWKATLRAGQKMVRQYKEERDINVYFLVDCSAGMLFGSGKKLKAEYIGEIVCVLANLIIGSGDRAGLVMYSDKDIKFLNPSNSKNQLQVIHKFLSDIKNYGGDFNIEKSLEFISRFAKGHSNNIVLISDFIHLKKGFEKNLFIVSSHADFFTIMVRDNMDDLLPKERYRFVIQDPSSEKQMIIDSRIAYSRFKEQSMKQKERVKDLFKKNNISLLELNSAEEFALPLSSFMKERASELRV
jgi:hypothetical protein